MVLCAGADANDNVYPILVDADGRPYVRLTDGLLPYIYDYIALTYTGDNLTGVVFKTGGAGGATVATLTLAYTGAVLDTVTRT